MAKPSGGCALARKEDVAIATALGASVLQAERYFYFTAKAIEGCAHHRKIAGGTAVTPLPNRYG
jgi:hypothetical protein